MTLTHLLAENPTVEKPTKEYQREVLGKTSQYFPDYLSVSLPFDLIDPVFDGVGLVAFKSRDNANL